MEQLSVLNERTTFNLYWLNIENTVTVSTDYEIFLFAGVVIYINREGGPQICFAYVTIRGKSVPGHAAMYYTVFYN